MSTEGQGGRRSRLGHNLLPATVCLPQTRRGTQLRLTTAGLSSTAVKFQACQHLDVLRCVDL